MTCVCGQEFYTSAPIQPDPRKEESWQCAGITAGLIWSVAVAISIAFVAFQKHPTCVAEQDRLAVQCDPCWHKYFILTAGIEGAIGCGKQELEPDSHWLQESASSLHVVVKGHRDECIRCDTLRDDLMTRALRDCSTRHTIAYVYELVTGGGDGEVAGTATGSIAGTGAAATTAETAGGGGGSKGNKQPVSMTTESISVVLASR